MKIQTKLTDSLASALYSLQLYNVVQDHRSLLLGTDLLSAFYAVSYLLFLKIKYFQEFK